MVNFKYTQCFQSCHDFFSLSITYKLFTWYSNACYRCWKCSKMHNIKKQMACSRQTVIAHNLEVLSLLSLLPLRNPLICGFPQPVFRKPLKCFCFPFLSNIFKPFLKMQNFQERILNMHWSLWGFSGGSYIRWVSKRSRKLNFMHSFHQFVRNLFTVFIPISYSLLKRIEKVISADNIVTGRRSKGKW